MFLNLRILRQLAQLKQNTNLEIRYRWLISRFSGALKAMRIRVPQQ